MSTGSARWCALSGAVPALILVPVSALAQYNETIHTARPGQAIGPFSVGAHVLQVRSGVEYNVAHFTCKDNTITEPGAVIRYGFGPEWGTFVKNYGSFGPSFEHRWDTRIAYLASNNLQWDNSDNHDTAAGS